MSWARRYQQEGVSALYLHIPFCASKCSYCDFSSWTTREGDPLMAAYVRSLRMQLSQVGELGLLDETITAYVGGGTPTLLGSSLLAGLVGDVRRHCPRLEELSVEANPDSLGDDVLSALVSSGATRVSVGIQSLNDGELTALGRLHDAREAQERLGAAVGSGLDVSCDLMCAIPRQTDRSWRESLEGVLEAGAGHVSVYPLAIEGGTALARRMGDTEPPWNDPDVQAERMAEAERILSAAGLGRYEVASYALPGKQCAHNRAYWTGLPYLGLGTGAASMLTRAGHHALSRACPQLGCLPTDASRVRLRISSGRAEIAATPLLSALTFEEELLTEHQALAEDLMLGARLSSGIGASLARTAQESFGASWHDAVRVALDRHLASMSPDGTLVPTETGWLLGNELYGLMWGLADGGE